MKKSELKHLIKEIVEETLATYRLEGTMAEFLKKYPSVRASKVKNSGNIFIQYHGLDSADEKWELFHLKDYVMSSNSSGGYYFSPREIKETIETDSQHWDADDMEIELDGKTYYVNAKFTWGEHAISHRHDPTRGWNGQGQDLRAEIPEAVEEIEAVDDTDQPVLDQRILSRLGEMALERFRDEEKGKRNPKWGNWV
jgi:hypothetical protein